MPCGNPQQQSSTPETKASKAAAEGYPGVSSHCIFGFRVCQQELADRAFLEMPRWSHAAATV